MIKRFFLGIFLLGGMSACNKDEKGLSTDPGWNNTNSTDELIIMSYNIRHCAPYYGSSQTSTPDVNNTASVIRRLKPNIVFLQEVDKKTKRSLGIDQVAELAKLAGYPFYYFFKAMDYQEGEYGIAILSGIELKECQSHVLPKEYPGGIVSGDFVVGTGRVRFANQEILLVNAHLSVNQSDRDKQMPYIIENIIGTDNRNILYCGDFNAIPSNNTIQQLTEAGFWRTNIDSKNFTIPSNSPNREIDYISYKPKERFMVINHLVHTGISASDHLPITSKIKINKTE